MVYGSCVRILLRSAEERRAAVCRLRQGRMRFSSKMITQIKTNNRKYSQKPPLSLKRQIEKDANVAFRQQNVGHFSGIHSEQWFCVTNQFHEQNFESSSTVLSGDLHR